MNKVKGILQYTIDALCPYCKEFVDLAAIHDDDYSLAKALFGHDGKSNFENWDNLSLEFQCPSCNEDLELEQIEY